jgi:energy-coupling factor transporter ATP-binding protein EcfA2
LPRRLPHVDRRLVEIARALATAPAVLLLDEPAAGLDEADTVKLGGLLQRLARAGLAVVLVEHDMSLVMSISDEIVVLDAGRRIARVRRRWCAPIPPSRPPISAPRMIAADRRRGKPALRARCPRPERRLWTSWRARQIGLQGWARRDHRGARPERRRQVDPDEGVERPDPSRRPGRSALAAWS